MPVDESNERIDATHFGKSALQSAKTKGGSVTQLLVSQIKDSDGNIEEIGDGRLFQLAIAQSGSLNFGMTHETFKKLGAAEKFLAKANLQNVNDLARLSEEQMRKAIESNEMWQRTSLMNEYAFRGSAIKVAENHYRARGYA